jgi:hypothetical protein
MTSPTTSWTRTGVTGITPALVAVRVDPKSLRKFPEVFGAFRADRPRLQVGLRAHFGADVRHLANQSNSVGLAPCERFPIWGIECSRNTARVEQGGSMQAKRWPHDRGSREIPPPAENPRKPSELDRVPAWSAAEGAFSSTIPHWQGRPDRPKARRRARPSALDLATRDLTSRSWMAVAADPPPPLALCDMEQGREAAAGGIPCSSGSEPSCGRDNSAIPICSVLPRTL